MNEWLVLAGVALVVVVAVAITGILTAGRPRLRYVIGDDGNPRCPACQEAVIITRVGSRLFLCDADGWNEDGSSWVVLHVCGATARRGRTVLYGGEVPGHLH